MEHPRSGSRDRQWSLTTRCVGADCRWRFYSGPCRLDVHHQILRPSSDELGWATVVPLWVSIDTSKIVFTILYCLYATLISFLYIQNMIYIMFTIFYRANLLNQCQVLVVLLHVFCITIYPRKVSPKKSAKNATRNKFSRWSRRAKGGHQRGHMQPHGWDPWP